MDLNLIAQHLTAKNVITAVTSIVTLASGICALVPTPNPNTTWGKLYRFIEIAALTIGKAKQTGIPGVDAIVAEAVKASAANAAADVKTGNQ